MHLAEVVTPREKSTWRQWCVTDTARFRLTSIKPIFSYMNENFDKQGINKEWERKQQSSGNSHPALKQKADLNIDWHHQ